MFVSGAKIVGLLQTENFAIFSLRLSSIVGKVKKGKSSSPVFLTEKLLRREAMLWWRQGLRDLDLAERLLDRGDYSYAAFHSHQAVEKALKAAIIHVLRELPPKIHNLIELVESLRSANLSIDDVLDDVKELNPHYLTSRYPDAANGVPSEVYTKRMGETCVRLARKVVEWIRTLLETRA